MSSRTSGHWKAFAAEGASVLVTARSTGKLGAVANAIRASGGTVETLARDLTEPDAASAAVAASVAAFGALDIVAHSAGATKYGDFFDLTDRDFEDGFALKYYGAVRLARAAP